MLNPFVKNVTKLLLNMITIISYFFTDCGNAEISLSDEGGIVTFSYMDYPKDTACQWVVTAPEGSRISAEFDYFNIEQYVDNFFISYEPRDVSLAGSLPIYSYTGDDPPPRFVSPGHVLYVYLITSTSSSAGSMSFGFSINLNEINNIRGM